MAHGDFVWCDLSAFGLADTQHFYAVLLGWAYQDLTQAD